jgi:hypothetical protein
MVRVLMFSFPKKPEGTQKVTAYPTGCMDFLDGVEL